jgi:hypothetical protein
MNNASRSAPPIVSIFDFQLSPFVFVRAFFDADLSSCLLIVRNHREAARASTLLARTLVCG